MSEEEELSYSDSIKKASALITRFPLIPVRGVPLMSHVAKNFDSVWAFRPDPSDLLIATYPKAGTHNSTHSLLWGAHLYSYIYIFLSFMLISILRLSELHTLVWMFIIEAFIKDNIKIPVNV